MSKWVKEKENQITFNDFPASFKPEARLKFYDYLKDNFTGNEPISYLEFGVYQGTSIKYWTGMNTNLNSRFDGFDTFEGLPEDWNLFKAGDMSTHGAIPSLGDDRVSFYKGLFQDTLADFLKTFERRGKLVINLDADLYSSTLFVLTSLHPFLQKGDILIFDEFNVPLDEFRAFCDYKDSYYTKLKLIAAVNNYYHAAFEVE